MEMKSRNQKRKKKKFSRKDLDELMGIHRDTYKRVRGAIKRK
ncbi:hypothetical protein [Bacillus smithii]